MNSTSGKLLGLVFGTGWMKTAKGLFKQLRGLPVIGYSTDFLKTYENVAPYCFAPPS